MLTGKALGAAIAEAIRRKGIPQIEVARAFNVKPPSVSGWLATGSISKSKLPALWSFFADVAGPEHWGLRSFPVDLEQQQDEGPKLLAALARYLQQVPPNRRAAAAGILQSWASEPERDDWPQLLEMAVRGKQLAKAA